jgi:hypothetical protein
VHRLRLEVSIQMKKKTFKHDLIFFSICGINLSNICAAPSAEGLHLDGEKIQARFNYFFHLWDNFSKIFAVPSAEGLYSNGEKIQALFNIVSICGINFSIFLQRIRLKVSVEIKTKVSMLQLFFHLWDKFFKNLCSAFG